MLKRYTLRIILTFCLLLFFISHFNATLLFKSKNSHSGYFELFFSERKAEFKTSCHTIAMWFFSYKVLHQALRRSCFFWCVSEVFCWIFIHGGMIEAVWLSGWPETSPFSQKAKQRVRTSSKVLLQFLCSAGRPITGSSSMRWQTPADFFLSPAEPFHGLRQGAEPGHRFPWTCCGPVKRPWKRQWWWSWGWRLEKQKRHAWATFSCVSFGWNGPAEWKLWGSNVFCGRRDDLMNRQNPEAWFSWETAKIHTGCPGSSEMLLYL